MERELSAKRKWRVTQRLRLRAEWIAANSPCGRCGSTANLDAYSHRSGKRMGANAFDDPAEVLERKLKRYSVLCPVCAPSAQSQGNLTSLSDAMALGWLAGLLEGEGCFSAPSGRTAAMVTLVMTDQDVVARAATLVGGATVNKRHSARQVALGHKPSYELRLRGVRALDLMRVLHPHMCEPRRSKIEEALSKAESRLPGTG